MIIDQLTPTLSDNLTDEVPVEQGTSTLKTTWQKIKDLFLGNTVLPTTAQTITGAIAELNTDLSGKAATDASNISSASAWLTALGTNASDYTIYDSVTDLGLTSGSATISGAWSAMSNGTILIARENEFASGQTPSSSATIEIVRFSASRGWIKAYDKYDTGGDYRMFLTSSNVPTGTWKQYTLS